VGYGQLVRILHAVIRDTLSVGSAPQILNQFYLENTASFKSATGFPFKSSNAKFKLQLYAPKGVSLVDGFDFNKSSVTITRYDIGFIVGSVLSWVSSLALVLGLVVVPLMQKSLNLLEVESIFRIPPHLRQPSLLKFTLASLRSAVFHKEDEFVRLSEVLDGFKNVAWQLKLQRTVRKLCPVNPLIAELLANGERFSPNDNDIVKLYTSEEDEKTVRFES
jgi:hypothetical protein